MNGMADFLKRTGVGIAMLTSLQHQYIDGIAWGIALPAQHRPILQRIQQVSRGQPLAQRLLDPRAHLVRSLRRVSPHAQVLHVLVEARDRRHVYVCTSL